MLEEWLNSMIAAYGPFGLVAVMVIQTIIAPISSEALLLFAGALGMGIVEVTVFGGIGLVIGAVIAFLIGRYGGRPIIDKMVGKKWTTAIDSWITENGARTILITRLVPFIPFDLISYISGVTSLSFKSYFTATVIGAFPRCLILAVLGDVAGRFLAVIGFSIELIIVAGIVGLVAVAILDRKGYLGSVEKGIMGRVMKKIFTAGSKRNK
jgi:uncharacterized membrane protein YdjX (TVP38/TMEM64 family)